MSQVTNNSQDRSAATEPDTTPSSSLPPLQDSSDCTSLIFQPQHNGQHTIETKDDDRDSDSDSDDDAGTLCPICHSIIVDAFITRCGHSYCHSCIARHLDKQKWCPVCRGTLLDTETCPNFSLNKVIERQLIKGKSRPRNTRNHANLKALTVYLDTLPYTEDVLAILSSARVKRKRAVLYEENIEANLLSAFLSMVEDYAAQKAAKWKRYQDLAFRDKLLAQQHHGRTNHSGQKASLSTPNYSNYSDGSESDDDHLDNNNDADNDSNNIDCDERDKDDGHNNRLYYSETSGNSINRRTKKRKSNDNDQNTRTPLTTSKELDLILATRRNRITPHFSGLMDFYFMERQKSIDGLARLSSTLYQLTRYSHWTPLDTIHYTDLSMTSSIVSSIEFDRDEDHFAVGGVNKEIKFYDYNMLNDSLNERLTVAPYFDDDKENPDSQVSPVLPNNNHVFSSIGEISSSLSLVHCPLSIIPCEHKISCLSWNPYIKSRIASSDYEGVVNLWDTNTGQNVRAYREHRQRAWSVDTCTSNPLIMASASDDSSVKIWSIHEKKSLVTLTQRGNVCCAKFAPNNRHLLAVGSADHRITCYDLRNTNKPLQVFSGHNKAVSYVKWSNDDEMISASTDNTLKLWKLGSNECIRTYSGHRNEKNFVGLSLKDDWISCGSENNTVYTYHKNSSQPVVHYKFSSMDPITGQETQNEDSFFVSSVCWKRDSMKALASNSKGVIKVLQLVE